MRPIYCLICCLIIGQSYLYAQSVSTGISVQGIARNSDKSALVSKDLTFTFTVKDEGGTTVYNETATITTDAFGVFSHIIGTGNATTNPFEDVMFHHEKLSLVISVEIDGVVTEISDAPFLYTGYAKAADNGVPTGSIMPYVGTTAPTGWVLCNGQPLTSIAGSDPLIALLGSNNAPDLRGMFLRGTGTSPVNSEAGPALMATQQDGFESHNHPGSTNTTGNHTHTTEVPDEQEGVFAIKNNDATYYQWDRTGAPTSSTNGNHSHTVSTNDVGTNETRPVNYGINYIIKL